MDSISTLALTYSKKVFKDIKISIIMIEDTYYQKRSFYQRIIKPIAGIFLLIPYAVILNVRDGIRKHKKDSSDKIRGSNSGIDTTHLN